ARRRIGSRDNTIATAFVRRVARRAAMGAVGGTVRGMAAIWALPEMDQAGSVLTGVGFQGWGWLWPLLIPVAAAAIGFVATRAAALKMLREVRGSAAISRARHASSTGRERWFITFTRRWRRWLWGCGACRRCWSAPNARIAWPACGWARCWARPG